MRLTSTIPRSVVLLLCILSLHPGAGKAQSLRRNFQNIERFEVGVLDTTIYLANKFVIPSSEIIYGDSIRLSPREDYDLHYSEGILVLRTKHSLDSLRGKSTILIYYNSLPFSFRTSYSHRTFSILQDSTARRSGRIPTSSTVSTFGNIFGDELQKSGSIFRGFSVGSNRELTLNSGFRLQFAGKLSSDVEILAALTDENTPIQPEGNTQTLQELDKVFVEIRGTDYEATLGDFYLDMTGGEFGTLSRKLQGAKGGGSYSSKGATASATVIGASARGKYNSNQFAGIEGVQGPYRLVGKNQERNIIVIAGTEKVYVDGMQMIRGETNDYAIDYASSEITFSSKRLVTSASRIVVDFQYTDRAYTRNFFAAEGKTNLFSEAVSLSVSYAREGDDQNAPIDISLSDSDKQILASAGSTIASR